MKNWKRFTFFAISAIVVLLACDNGNGKETHTHEWGEWKDTVEVTCTEPAKQTRTCQIDLSHVETRDKPGTSALGHLWGEWAQSGTVETRTCTRDGCTASDTRIVLSATKNFTSDWTTDTQIANKNFNAPAPLSSNINRNVMVVSDTAIQSRIYSTMLIIIDDEGYGWESDGFIGDNRISSYNVYGLAVPITVYANEGYGWYQVTENYYKPEKPSFGNSSLGTSFTMTQNWLYDSRARPFNTTTSFYRIRTPDDVLYKNLSDIAQNPDEWSITTAGGTLTIKLGAPKDEYLYSFDTFKTFFCSQGGIDLFTDNANLKLLDFSSASTYNFHSLATDCRGQGCTIICQGYLLYTTEDAAITGYAYEGASSTHFVYEVELKTGWNVVWKNYNEKTISTRGVFGNHVLWRISN